MIQLEASTNGMTRTKLWDILVSDFTVSDLVVSADLLLGLLVNWKSPAPSKVRAFGWQLLHDRIPTRVNLGRRQIIDGTGDLSCVMCGLLLEDSNHLFIYCEVAMRVWEAVFAWLQLPFSLPHNLLSILLFLTHNRGKKLRKGLCMIWNGVVWTIWRRRNLVLFDNGGRGVAEIIDEIKVTTWKWWISQTKVPNSLLYEWQMEPILCMVR